MTGAVVSGGIDVGGIGSTFPMFRSFYHSDMDPGYLQNAVPARFSGGVMFGHDRRAADVDVSRDDIGRRLSGFFLTLNGKTMWHLMRSFETHASVVESEDALKAKGYDDTVLMKKMVTWVNVKRPKKAILGDIYITKRGIIYAYVNKTLKWVEVGKLDVSGDGVTPVIDIPIHVSNKPNDTMPATARVGDFWVSTFNGYESGLFVREKQNDGTWADRDSRIEFTKHIEISISAFPNVNGEGEPVAPSFEYVRNAECQYTSTAYYDAYSWWGAQISRYTSEYTNKFSLTIDSSDDPTTFVMDANSLLPGSPVRQDSFYGTFSFVLLNHGEPLNYVYTMTSTEDGRTWSFSSGKTLPYTEWVDFIGYVTHDAPVGSQGSVRVRSGQTGSVVPTLSIKSGATSDLVNEDGDGITERRYRFRIDDSVVLMPYMNVQDNYNISGGWLYPEVLYPGAYRVYYYPATVVRHLYSTDSQYYRLFDTEHSEYAADRGGFDIMKVTFPTGYQTWSDDDYCDDGVTLFPHNFVIDPENMYHCDDISAGVAIKFSATSGGNKTSVSF